MSIDPNLTLALAQEKVCDLINDYRDNVMLNYFTFEGIPWNCDPQSVQNVMGVCILAILNGNNLPPTYQWRDYNNTMHNVTGMFMYGMMAAGGTFVTMVYTASWQHKANITALTDPIAVQEYDYMSTLWPDPNIQYGV